MTKKIRHEQERDQARNEDGGERKLEKINNELNDNYKNDLGKFFREE